MLYASLQRFVRNSVVFDTDFAFTWPRLAQGVARYLLLLVFGEVIVTFISVKELRSNYATVFHV